uniref:CBM21 domain-containing protein n=1 Tax=Periophthalmus magnuspinnatus TaxID=409849 RepID=A0A3B4AJP0_9GOBI
MSSERRKIRTQSPPLPQPLFPHPRPLCSHAYLRIQRALSEGKRVSFADTTGRDLVDVKEFTAFDSDEEDGGKWEEEQAKYRLSQGEPVFHVQPEFSVRSGGDLLQAVRKNKVEVENISVVEDEPLAVSGVIRVLNISFNKAVYVRCTMDSWSSYYDHPADYVQGSHDGDTDQFCFKLCFASPYTTHGSRMEFVVRYETSEGDYWANNSNMNYVLTLLLSYEDKSSETHTELRDVRSILKPPKTHRYKSRVSVFSIFSALHQISTELKVK